MNKKILSPLLVAFCAVGFTSSQASAAITITGFSITANSITLRVVGNLPTEAPAHNASLITLLNNDFSGGYVFSQTGAFPAVSTTFNGPDTFDFFITGDQANGDYVSALFKVVPLGGESFTGTITAIWADEIFDPNAIVNLSNLELYWGSNANGDLGSGVFLAAVPEPSTVALLSAGAAALLAVAVRRRRSKA